MRKIEQYERIRLKDSREGCVVEILGDQEAFLIDIGSDTDSWDTILVDRDQIIDE